MKYLIFLLLLSSCNFFKTVTGDKPTIDNGFADGGGQESTIDLSQGIYGFWKFEETAGANRVDQYFNRQLIDQANVPKMSGPRGASADCNAGVTGDPFFLMVESFNYSADYELTFAFWVNKSTNPLSINLDHVVHLDTNYIKLEDLDSMGDLSDLQVTINSQFFNFYDVVDFDGATWHHFVVVIHNGGRNVSLYVNGEFVDNLNDGIQKDFISTQMIVCSNATGFDHLKGKIDSLGMWERALSADEIKALYTSEDF
jgi:hypothetical protein